MSDENAIEYGGVKLSGSKLLLIIPLLTTICGSLWGGFELYNRLLQAEETLNSIDPVAISSEINRMESVYTLVKEDLAKQIQQTRESVDKDISRLRIDLELIDDKTSEINSIVKKSESDLSNAERELRDDVYEMEKQMQESFKEVDKSMKQMQIDLDNKIKETLSNPLNNTTK